MAQDSDLPGYELIETVHESATTAVVRARRVADGATVIIKRSVGEAISARQLTRYLNEHELLSSLSCSGVVAVHDLVRHAGNVALVLEDCPGVPLREWIEKRGSASTSECLEIAVQLADTIAAVHAAHIIHKDLNSHNIVYDPGRRRTKLLDFGIATRLAAVGGKLETPGALEGTLAYIAPEQTGRMSRVLDSRADLYSLGITLYEVFTGTLPHDNGDPLEIVHFHIAGQPEPPHERDPRVPQAVSDIIVKLLQKEPANRYRSAAGLAADLRACAVQAAEHGTIVPFKLGTSDLLDRFDPPQALFGRDDERALLAESFEHAAAGGVAAVLIDGPAGSGKTALVREIQQSIARRRGYLVSGTFERLERSVPFGALVNALQELVAQLLTESESAVAAWREAILAAVQGNGQLVVDVVPALELIIGAQPSPAELSAQETRDRFQVTFQNFVQVFCTKDHPLVLFLDDVQWADPASLTLVSRILGARATESLLVVLAYRGAEAAAQLPFFQGLDAQAERGLKLTRVDLPPLAPAAVQAFVAAALRVSPEDAADLAAVVHDKTAGNPFFMRQFVDELHARGHLRFDAHSKAFRYDLEAVRRAAMTENVADLHAAKLVKLPEGTRAVLRVAATVGSRFDLDTVAAVCKRPAADVAAYLGAAVEAGLIAPASPLESLRPGDLHSPLVYRKFAFLHDRVQHAAAAALDGVALSAVHLAIGRVLRAALGGERGDARLFDAVSHLNNGSELIHDPAERRALAELNLQAAAKARNATAYDVAVQTLRQAVGLLGAAGWQDARALTFEAHARLAESLALKAEHDEALKVIAAAREHAANVVERGELALLETMALAGMGKVAQSLESGRRGAALFGIELPTDPITVQEQIKEEIAAILARTAALGPDKLLELPLMTDPDSLAVMPLLAYTLPSASQTDKGMFALICCKMVSLSLDHGNCSLSPRAYGSFAGVLAGAFGHYRDAYRFAKLGVDLGHRLNDASALSGAYFLFAMFASPWVRPVEESVELLRRGVQHGLQTGDHQHAAYSATRVVSQLQFRGAPLDKVHEEARAAAELLRSLGDEPNLRFLETRVALIDWLRGERTPAQSALLSASEAQIDERIKAAGNKSFASDWLLVRTMHRYFAGDYRGCFGLAHANESLIPYTAGFVTRVEHTFFQSLAIAALHGGALDAERAALETLLDRNRKLLAGWAALCPDNFSALQLLVEAEHERIRGSELEAMHGYDKAIAAARAFGAPHIEGLAAEAAARYWLAADKSSFGRLYLDAALRANEIWGAHGRCADLRAAFDASPLRAGPTTSPSTRPGTTIRTATERVDSLDLATVIKASQAIAGEIVPERLFATLTTIIVESAGAERGALVLDVEGELVVRSVKAQAAERSAVTVSEPLGAHAGISAGVVHFVVRTRDHVVLAEPALRGPFRGDPYVRREQPKSILCAPIVHKGKIKGAIYLENNQVAGAFTPQRLEAINILLAQIAVSLENAALYGRQEKQRRDIEAANVNLKAEIAERRRAELELNRYKEHLEELVRERTKELEAAQDRLVDVSRRAGMAEVASGVLHNVGNVMNSVNVGASVVRDAVRTLPVERLQRALQLLDDNATRLPEFLTKDTAGRRLPEYLAKLAEVLAAEKSSLLDSLGSLSEHLEHMKKIIAAQQSYAKMKGMVEACSLEEIAESALAINDEPLRVSSIRVIRNFAPLPHVVADRHQVLQILVNLISNAKHALDDRNGDRELTITTARDGAQVRLEVRDNGSGITPANLARIFTHGFTTKRDGHGFGLHNCANAAQEMGGSLTAESAGFGQGACFVLKLPAQQIEPQRSGGLAVAGAKR